MLTAYISLYLMDFLTSLLLLMVSLGLQYFYPNTVNWLEKAIPIVLFLFKYYISLLFLELFATSHQVHLGACKNQHPLQLSQHHIHFCHKSQQLNYELCKSKDPKCLVVAQKKLNGWGNKYMTILGGYIPSVWSNVFDMPYVF